MSGQEAKEISKEKGLIMSSFVRFILKKSCLYGTPYITKYNVFCGMQVEF